MRSREKIKYLKWVWFSSLGDLPKKMKKNLRLSLLFLLDDADWNAVRPSSTTASFLAPFETILRCSMIWSQVIYRTRHISQPLFGPASLLVIQFPFTRPLRLLASRHSPSRIRSPSLLPRCCSRSHHHRGGGPRRSWHRVWKKLIRTSCWLRVPHPALLLFAVGLLDCRPPVLAELPLYLHLLEHLLEILLAVQVARVTVGRRAELVDFVVGRQPPKLARHNVVTRCETGQDAFV